MNSVQLVGHLSRAPVVRFEPDSHQVTTWTLAIEELGYGQEGKKYILYCPCVAYGRTAESASLLSAGDVISVSGKLSWRKQVGKCKQEHSIMVVNVREVAVLQAAMAVHE
jgi:single-stranded DNA-binding protein